MQTNTLKLAFVGDSFREGTVPLSVLADKLKALQQAVFHAAATVSDHPGVRRGGWTNRFRHFAELIFVAAHHSDLTIEMKLPDVADSTLRSLGHQTIDLLFSTARAAVEGPAKLANVNRIDQEYLLRAIESVMPNVGDQYSIRLENGNAYSHAAVELDGNARRRLKERLFEAEQVAVPIREEPVTLVGEVITIRVNSGKDGIVVRHDHREIDCFAEDFLRDRIANLVAGSLVEVSGLATLNDFGQVAKIVRIVDIDPVSMEPLRMTTLYHGGRIYRFTRPLTIDIEYVDGYWIYHNPDINLWGYANKRDDALQELSEAFAYLYHELAEEADQLDPVAAKIRDDLLSLVV